MRLSRTDKGWLAVEWNIWRAQGKLVQLAKILGREGADNIMVGSFYVAVEKAVMLFGTEMRVPIPWLEKALKGFHNLGKESWSWRDCRVGLEDGERIIWYNNRRRFGGGLAG